jgi:predicted outer membrane repeat protein
MTSVSRKTAMFHGLFGSLIIGLMMSSRPAVAGQPDFPANTAAHTQGAAIAATQTATAAPSTDDARDPSQPDPDSSMSSSDHEDLKPITPQQEALFREFLQWQAMREGGGDTGR